jgi:CRP-like cAMP-binding protein
LFNEGRLLRSVASGTGDDKGISDSEGGRNGMTLLSNASREQYSRRNSLLAALSADATRLLGRHLQETEIREGILLWDVDSDGGRIFFPISGIISVRVPTRDGHGIDVATIGPEGAAGFHEAAGTMPVWTQAVVQAPGRFATITATAFAAAAAEIEELEQVAAVCKAWLLLQSQRAALCNAVHSADARFCRWLLRTSDALGLDIVRVTQEAIAEALGIRRTTANLIAQQLQWKGTISCGRGKIAIRDRAALQSAACECYSVLDHSHWPCELLRTNDSAQRVESQIAFSSRI